jgi:thiamine kinase-like enzyme
MSSSWSRGSSPVLESVHSLSTAAAATNTAPSSPESLTSVKLKALDVFNLNDTSLVDIIRLVGGASNQIFMATAHSKSIVIRIYGEGVNALIGEQRPFEVLVSKTFGELGLGPKVLRVWEDGRAEEFLTGNSLKRDHLFNEKVLGNLASKLALLHSSDLGEVKSLEDGEKEKERIPWVVKVVNSWSEIAKRVQDGKFVSVVEKLVADFHQIAGTLWKRYPSDIVLCHNDLNAGNALVSGSVEDADVGLYLLDYEYAGYNYRAYDLGNIWCETFMDNHCHEYPYFAAYPNNGLSIATLKKFCENYLQARNSINNEDQFEFDDEIGNGTEAINSMVRQVIAYSLGSHVVWGLWGLTMSQVQDIPFGFEEYGLKRIELFYKFQTLYEQYLS